MGLDLQIRVAGTKETAEAFNRAGSKVRENVQQAILEGAQMVKEATAAGILAGRVVKERTGQLRRKLVIAYGESARGQGSSMSADVFSEASNNSKGYRKGRYGFILAAGVNKHVIRVGAQRRKDWDVMGSRVVVTKTGKIRHRKYLEIRGFKGGYRRVHQIAPRPWIVEEFLPLRDDLLAHIERAVEAGVLSSEDLEKGGD